ncbi:MAG: arginase family protein [Xanthomonadales bacterium]|nr:arginase family protein [Xanthomonadales bacterium]
MEVHAKTGVFLMQDNMLSGGAISLLLLALLLPILTVAQGPIDTPEHIVGTDPYPFDTRDPRVKIEPAIELPESITPKLELLTAEQIEFLKSSEARTVAGSAKKTVEALEEQSPEEVKAWVEAIQFVIDENRYIEGRDSRNIPLNTQSPEFNAWRLKRPQSMDPEREPGPIKLGRYDGNGGPRTFGGHPLALTPADLIAGEVDVAILGAPLNMGSGWRDSGGRATAELRLLGRSMGGPDQYVQVNSSKILNIVDYGDVAIDNNSTERSMQHVREIVREIVTAGAVPMIVGG